MIVLPSRETVGDIMLGWEVGRRILREMGDPDAAELGNPMPSEPLLFLKAPSTIIGDGDFIELPESSQRVEHEGELAVVIGRRCARLEPDEDPLAYVLGYTCVNDVTAVASELGGTLTITNIGALGIDTGTPIINPGEVAIVAFGTIKPPQPTPSNPG